MTGAQLKALRKSLGLSLSQAARLAEVSVRSWARYETQATVPAGPVKLVEFECQIRRPGDPWPLKPRPARTQARRT